MAAGSCEWVPACCGCGHSTLEQDFGSMCTCSHRQEKGKVRASLGFSDSLKFRVKGFGVPEKVLS